MSPAIPPAAEFAATCREVIGTWHRRDPPLDWRVVGAMFGGGRDGWQEAMADLCVINCFQWHLEDECRAHYADAVRLAALKREIDASNRRRVLGIDALDERLARELAVSYRGTEPVALATPGNVLDRISILELKREHAVGEPHVVAIIDEQLEDICTALDRLVADLAAARQRVKHFPTVKLYGGGDGRAS